jgi:hypothetical protein
VPDRMGKPARDPFQIGENTITPLVMQAAEGVTEERAVIHHETCAEPSGALLASQAFLDQAFLDQAFLELFQL